MPVVRELLARELLMLVVLGGLGAGPAAFLSPRFRAVERAALAPVLGMCLGTAVFTTLIYFFRAADTAWLVPVLVVASVGVALARSRHVVRLRRPRGQLVAWASIALVVIVITVPIVSVMRSQHTIGPVSYAVGDAAGYVAETDGFVHSSVHGVLTSRPPFTDLTQRFLRLYSRSYQNLDLAPLSANVNSVASLGSTATWQAFLIAFVVAGGLGALAAVRWMLRESDALAVTFGGATAGVMFAGALFFQLYFADSQAALCGLAILLPLGAVAADAVIEPRAPSLVLTALLISGLLATYPLLLAPVGVVGGAVVLWLLVRRWRSAGPGLGSDMRRGAAAVAGLIIVAAGLNLVSFLRDLRYWRALATGRLNATAGFPAFYMKAGSLPAWLFQTRNLFTLPPSTGSGLAITVEEIILPVVFAAVAVVALRRFRTLSWLLLVIAVAAVLGEYEAARHACSYCTDRSLLPIAPMLVGLFAAGVGALWMSRRWWARAAGLVAVFLWLVPAFTAERDLHRRVSGAGTFLRSSDRAALAHLPPDASVAIEGFDADPNTASPVDPFAYEMADEESNGHATLPGDVSDNNAIAYFGPLSPLDAGQFNPYYRYVLTRLPGIDTDRQIVAREAGVALERRVEPLDVIADGGLVAPNERLDPTGSAWLATTMPLRLVVAGPGTAPAYVALRILESVPARVTPHQPGVWWRRHGDQLFVCVRATGTAPFRVAQFGITYTPVPSNAAVGPYVQPPVGIGVQLAAMTVAAGRCPSLAGSS